MQHGRYLQTLDEGVGQTHFPRDQYDVSLDFLDVVAHVVVAPFDQVDNLLYCLQEDVLEPGVESRELLLESILAGPLPGQGLGRPGDGVELDYAVPSAFLCGIQRTVGAIHHVRVRLDVLGAQVGYAD